MGAVGFFVAKKRLDPRFPAGGLVLGQLQGILYRQIPYVKKALWNLRLS